MIKNKPASPHIKIEMRNATLAWDSSHSSIQNSPELTPKMKKDKRATRAKKEKSRQLQHTEHQAVLAEQKGHLLLDSDERPSPEEEEGKQIHTGSPRLQRTLYSIDLEIEEVSYLSVPTHSLQDPPCLWAPAPHLLLRPPLQAPPAKQSTLTVNGFASRADNEQQNS